MVMAGWWMLAQTTRSRCVLALIALAVIVAGCSGPDDGSAPSTATPTEVPTVVATSTPSANAAPTTTIIPAVATPTTTTVVDAPTCAEGVELLGHSDVLDKVEFDDSVVGGLSALARDGDGDAYYALSDRDGRVYTLDFPIPGTPTITATVRLRDASGEPDTAIDGEGLAVLPDGDLLVSSEVEPSIRQYTSGGQHVADLPVPERFLVQPVGRAAGNATFESLALAPSGQRLFTAVEQPLDGDGTTGDGRGRIRILRYDLVDGAFQPAAEYLYLSEPDQGVSEIVAISDTELLVLERGLSLLSGFSARVFHVRLEGVEDVSSINRLDATDAQPAPKELLVDVADCPDGDNAASGEFNPLLENFESMAFGPELPDGRQTLIVGSDDNFQSFQVTRFLVFAVDPDRF
jgi:hypothetical protein